jgi:hypothetical protein
MLLAVVHVSKEQDAYVMHYHADGLARTYLSLYVPAQPHAEPNRDFFVIPSHLPNAHSKKVYKRRRNGSCRRNPKEAKRPYDAGIPVSRHRST